MDYKKERQLEIKEKRQSLKECKYLHQYKALKITIGVSCNYSLPVVWLLWNHWLNYKEEYLSQS